MARKVKTFGAALGHTEKPVKVVDASVDDGLSSFVQGMSTMAAKNTATGMGTYRDQRSYTSYSPTAPQNRVTLESLYRFTWLGRRIIDTLPDDMLRPWRKHKWEGQEDDDKNVKTLRKVEKRLGVKRAVLKTACEGRLYGGALLIPVLRSQDDSVLDQPLDYEDIQKDDLIALRTVDRWRCSHDGTYDTDPSSPQFGMPTHYLLAESAVRLHHTRVIRFDGRELPYWLWRQNAMWHDSVMQILINNLKGYDTAVAAITTMLFQANVDVVAQQGLRQALATKDGEARVINRFRNFALGKGLTGVSVIDKDTEEFQRHPYTFSGVDKAFDKVMYDICGAADVPFTRLFGQSPAGMNATGESDTRNYYDHVAARREQLIDPPLTQLDEFVVRSALGHMPEEYEYEWNPLWQESSKEKADAENTRATTAKTYVDMGAIDEGVVAGDLYARGVYSNLTKKHVKLAEELAKEPDPQPMLPLGAKLSAPAKGVRNQAVTTPQGKEDEEDDEA